MLPKTYFLSYGTFRIASHAVRFLNPKRFSNLLYLPFSFLFDTLSLLMLILAFYSSDFLITPIAKIATLFFRQYEYDLLFRQCTRSPARSYVA